MEPRTRTADDLQRAVTLAESHFPAGHAAADYRLVRAERLLAGHARCPTPRCWHLTFKPSALVPTNLPARVTAGGELFMLVDLDAGRAELVGFGE